MFIGLAGEMIRKGFSRINKDRSYRTNKTYSAKKLKRLNAAASEMGFNSGNIGLYLDRGF